MPIGYCFRKWQPAELNWEMSFGPGVGGEPPNVAMVCAWTAEGMIARIKPVRTEVRAIFSVDFFIWFGTLNCALSEEFD